MSFPHFGKKQKFFSKENPQLEQNFALNWFTAILLTC
jgi:hypothetical protein